MNSSNRQAAIAALIILVVFGVGAYLMPRIMLALGEHSPIIAGAVAAGFVLSFFLLFWLRSRR